MRNNAVLTPFQSLGSRRVCRLEFVILSTLIGLLWAAIPAQAQRFKVGSFVKTSGTVSVDQAVAHGLGEAPKALILWTDAKSSESFSAEVALSFGFTDGTTSRSVGVASQNGVTPSNAARRLSSKLLTIIPPTDTSGPLVEAAFKSWDATNFTITWNPNTATSYVIHYIAIGGSDVSAKALDWRPAHGTGNKAVTGVGFQPTVVLHAHAGSFSGELDSTVPSLMLGLGVMDFGGGQWANAVTSIDAVATSDTQRGQQTDAAIFDISNALAVTQKAAFTSMDADGFTLNYSVALGVAPRMISLALSGVNVHAGSFSKSTSTSVPVSQAVPGSNFTPAVVLLSSFQDVVRASPVAQTRIGLGAASATAAGSSAVADKDASATTSTQGLDKTSKAFVKVNNATSTIDAEADLASMDADGFTLSWTKNDAVATQMLYLAFGQLRWFGYMKPITIDRTKVGVTGTAATTLTDFPLLINCADANLATTANGGHVTSASGYDIVFRSRDYAICGGVLESPCQLDHEIEKYDGTTGQLTAWVRIPSLNTNAASSNTGIWVYYGNADVTTSLENKSGVWDSGYQGVWHLKEAYVAAGDYKDSTANGRHGSGLGAGNNPTQTTSGKIGNAQSYDGTDGITAVGYKGVLGTSSRTLSAWFTTSESVLPVS